MNYQIRYCHDPFTGNYIVSLLGTAQNLVSLPQFFRAKTGVSNRAVLGSATLSAEQCRSIGFILPEEVNANDNVQSAVLSA